MIVELVTCVMIREPATGRVLVQDRKLIYPGWSFPGGHVERGESAYNCAVREVREETGLEVKNLIYCGMVHWTRRDTDDRYICFMYKTEEFEGGLIPENEEGAHFWVSVGELFAAPPEKISSVHYSLSPLFHEFGRFSEAHILWSGEESTWEIEYY